MRLLCFADFHLGIKSHGKIDPITGLNTREIQTLGVLDELIDYAINQEIKVIVAAGDMYKNNLPSPTIQDEFNKRVQRATENDIQFLILDGNHDVSKLETTSSPLKPFTTLKIKNVIHTRVHKEYIYSDESGKKYKFVFLPTYHTKDEIESIINETDTSIPTIVIGHMTIRGALLNDWLIEEKETYIDLDTFKKPGIKAVILGHLHKHQILNEEPLVFYTGSTQRIDFNEEKQPKGFVVLDINDKDVNYEFVEIESQKFFTLKLDLKEELDPTEALKKAIKKNSKKINNAIVRINVELKELMKIEEKEIYDDLYKLGAFNVLNIKKEYDEEKRTRNKSLNEHVSMNKALEIHYKGKTRSKERIILGKEIIKKIEEEAIYE